MWFSARAVRVKGKPRLRAVSAAAAIRSAAWPGSYRWPSRSQSSIEPPTAPASAARVTAVAAPEREREPGAGRRDRLEPEPFEHPGGAGVPRVRDHERLAGVQGLEAL